MPSVFLRQGYKPLFTSLVIFCLLYYFGFSFLSFVAFLFAAFFAIFYLNPEREPEEDDEFSLIAPIDGKIISITPTKNKVDITIQNSWSNAHLIRAPFGGILQDQKIINGLNLPRSHAGAQDLNTNMLLEFRKDGAAFFLALTNGGLKIKNSLFLEASAPIKTAKRVGFFSGGKAVFSCPSNTDLKVCVGDKLQAGKSLIGFIKNGQQTSN